MIWKVVPSFPDYEVSEYGDLKTIRTRRGGPAGRLMKAYVREDGYRMYIIRRDGRSFHKKAHQLVIEAFIGSKPFESAEVCHNDGTRTNDHYTNLRWDTRSANHLDKRKHGTSLQGERSPFAKLTVEIVLEMHSLRAKGVTQREIGEMFGMLQPHVGRILRGERWGHVHPQRAKEFQ